MASETSSSTAAANPADATTTNHESITKTSNGRAKLHGRAFYESIGSPKFIIAPMVDQSEFAWRMLSRSFLPPPERPSILAYSPMLHARLFAESQKYRDSHFQPTRAGIAAPVDAAGEDAAAATSSSSSGDDKPWLDGNPAIDRPLFVQFCANDPSALLAAARLAAPYCDAVDLNLGCPQGIARKGHYGAFLQEDQQLIHDLIRTLHEQLPVPVTAKIRILETREATLAYARNVLDAGASILTVHGRRREQKGHWTGLADWSYIRYLRENLPPETVIFANGNILQHGDLEKCLEATGADGVMSAEGNLSDPGLFAPAPPVGEEGREYWRGKDGRGGWRVDAVFRRYLDILHKYALDQEPPTRRPLFMPGDSTEWLVEERTEAEDEGPARKKRRKDMKKDGGKNASQSPSPNLGPMQPHLFHVLRHFVSRHTDIRDMLARAKGGDITTYEKLLDCVERRVAEGLLEYERTGGKSVEEPEPLKVVSNGDAKADAAADSSVEIDDTESSVRTVKKCKRPWWVTQPIIRPLPKEAIAKGAIQMKKKDRQNIGTETQQEPVTTPQEQSATTAELERKTSFPASELVAG